MKKIIPFPLWQSEWLIRWLEEQSRDGWKLKRIRMGVAEFEGTTRTRLRYGLFTSSAATDEDLERRRDKDTAELAGEMQDYYAHRGWEDAVEYGSGFFFMTRRQYDALPPPDLREQLDEQRKTQRKSAVGSAITIFTLVLTAQLKLHDDHTLLRGGVMLFLLLFLVATVLYGVFYFRRAKEEQRPRDVSEEEFQRQLRRAHGVYAMKVCVQMGIYLGIIWQIVDLILSR